MVVGIGDVAAKAAVRWGIRFSQNPAAKPLQVIDHRLHRLAGEDIVGKGEGTGPCEIIAPPY